MSATNTFENQVAALLFNGTAIPNLADNASSSPVTSYWISLHTADPGEAGNQETSETEYTGYARLEATRDSSGWTVSGNAASNTSQLTFGQCTASPGDNITHVGIGLSETGTGTLLGSLALTNEISMAVGATPIFSASALAPAID